MKVSAEMMDLASTPIILTADFRRRRLAVELACRRVHSGIAIGDL
jgi:hypothetical protein